jgi:hypothetical protein
VDLRCPAATRDANGIGPPPLLRHQQSGGP